MDWGGTLVSDDDKANKLQAYALATGKATCGSSKDLTDLLARLSSDMRNHILWCLARSCWPYRSTLGIKNLGLGAEHGFYYRWPRDEENTMPEKEGDAEDGSSSAVTKDRGIRSKWQTLSEFSDQTWKESARLLMQILRNAPMAHTLSKIAMP